MLFRSREAANSLILMGPPGLLQLKSWKSDLERIIRQEKDKSVLLWSRVCLVRNDPAGPKDNKVHLDAIGEVLKANEEIGRLEACQAFALLGEEGVSRLKDLISLVLNPAEKPEVRAAAVVALSTMKSQAATIKPILEGLLKDFTIGPELRKIVSDSVTAMTVKPAAPAPPIPPVKK